MGTKSEQKNIVKHSSITTGFNSTEIVSTFSLKQSSQKSCEEIQFLPKADYSQKSEKVNLNKKLTLFDRGLMGSLKFKIESTPLFGESQNMLSAPFINLLEDGV